MQFRHYLVAVALAATSFSVFSQEEIEQPFDIQTVAVIESVTTPVEVTPENPPKRSFPSFLTERQITLIEQAFKVAIEDKHKDPELLPGLLMQETTAGVANYKAAKNNCFGIFQIKIAAARDVLNHFPDLVLQFGINPTNNTAIRQRLIHDDEFNTVVASKYLLILKRYGYDTIRSLALAYNQGPGGAKRKDPNKFAYSNGVVKHIRILYK